MFIHLQCKKNKIMESSIFKGHHFANYCLYFITAMCEELKKAHINNKGDSLELIVETKKFPYYFDAIAFIKRALKRENYEVSYPTYSMAVQNSVMIYKYVWNIVKE